MPQSLMIDLPLQITTVTQSFSAITALKGVPFDIRTTLWTALLVLTGSIPLAATDLRWDKLPPIPATLGVAGAFSGVSGGSLLIAGGANFPGKMPWEGGTKVWRDDIFGLEQPNSAWRVAGKLPFPLGYGVAFSDRRGLICVGGSGPDRHHTSVVVLNWSQGRLTTNSLPDLPEPRANHCGALLGNLAFLFGGSATPDATNALNSLLSMDLGSADPRWQSLEPLPARGRIFATAGVHEGSFYVFGGAALKRGPDGKPVRDWLRETWRYTPGKGWKRLADLPRVAVAAPSPAPLMNGKLLVIGGDDGAQVSTPPEEHKGFRRDVLAYDPKTDKWETRGEAPFAHVTTSTVLWKDLIVVPSGEIRPGVRSPEVWSTPAR